MVVHYALPKIKTTVTHGASTYQLEGYSLLTDVFLVENGVSQAVIRASDTKGETFLNKVDVGNNIKIELQFEDAPGASWTQVFGGWAFDLTPKLSEGGETVTVTARGYGLALLAMLVGEEYGSESANSSLNTIKEVLTDATKGVVPKWVEKVLNTADDSEYAIDTSKVADVTSNFRYLYWPYKPALKCLDDMIDLISAANAPSAGAHWIIVPSGTTAHLCLATVGAHENPPADVWPTWWNTDQAGSTIQVTEDMLVSRFTKQRSEANYILYHGKLRKPVDGDKWTEQTPFPTYWGRTDCSLYTANAVGYYKIGGKSLHAEPTQGVTGYWWYPTGQNAGWNISAIGGQYNVPSLNFYVRINANVEAPISVDCDTSTGNYFRYNLLQDLSDESGNLVTDQFFHINIPVGPYAKQDKTRQRIWSEVGSPDWGSINWISFRAKSKAGVDGAVYLDGLHFAGWILRGARDDAKIGTQRARVKLIVDDMAKDDSTTASDDSYVMGQLAKAELYRAVTTPIIGTFVIPGKETILPGQLCHVHFGKKNGSFNIDSDMRFLKVNHRFAPEPHGFRSYLTVTDDVLNSRALEPNVGYNLLMKAINPGFQTRERASQKTRDIDITQVILSKNYST